MKTISKNSKNRIQSKSISGSGRSLWRKWLEIVKRYHLFYLFYFPLSFPLPIYYFLFKLKINYKKYPLVSIKNVHILISESYQMLASYKMFYSLYEIIHYLSWWLRFASNNISNAKREVGGCRDVPNWPRLDHC